MRPYNSNDLEDKEWNSDVYSKVKTFIPDFLGKQPGSCASTQDIRNNFKQEHPDLCDDTIARSEQYPQQLKWHHLVDSVMQNLKKTGVITGGRDASVPGKWCLVSKPIVDDGHHAKESRPSTIAIPPVASSGDDAERSIAKNLLEQILSLSPKGFEMLVGEYLKAKRFADVKVTGTSHDDGIDGRCTIPFIDVTVAFQAKRYKTDNIVGISPVQRLNGSLGNTYDRGVFITTSSFSSSAKSWIEEERIQITLVDGEELVKQLIELELGIKTVPVVRHEIDERFFDELNDRS